MAHKTQNKLVLILVCILLLDIAMVKSAHYDKKTIEGMVLKTLWEKVFAGYDATAKEEGIKKIRKTDDYSKLINQLLSVKKEKVQHILNLLAEIMIAYSSQ